MPTIRSICEPGTSRSACLLQCSSHVCGGTGGRIGQPAETRETPRPADQTVYDLQQVAKVSPKETFRRLALMIWQAATHLNIDLPIYRSAPVAHRHFQLLAGL